MAGTNLNNLDDVALKRAPDGTFWYINGNGGWQQFSLPDTTVINDDIVTIDSISQFPTAVNGVRYLETGKTYIITRSLDLLGDRLECLGVCNLFGTSSETSFLTSTGLDASTPFLTTEYSIVIENITFKDLGTCLSIDGNTRTVALDWENVNFENVAIVGTINTCDNFIYETGAFLGAQGLKFLGTIGTVGFSNSLFRGLGTVGNIIEIDATCIITRRFRIIYSSIIAFGSTDGILVNALATVPIEGYILDTVNFSGGGTYTSGVTYTSEKALFINCIGVINTTAIANMYMKNNATATVVSEIGARYAMAGTTQINAIIQKFTHIPLENAVQYTSSVSRIFRVLITFNLLSTNNNVLGFYIGVNRGGAINPTADRISESELYVTASGTRPDAGAIQAIVELNQDDKVYMIVQNTTATNNITIGFMNMTIERTN